MKQRDYTSLFNTLGQAYAEHSPRSAALNAKAKKYLVDGGSHTIRLAQPFPPRLTAAHGAWVQDEDGHRLLDLWQGHYANLLGHNPEIVTHVLAEALASGIGLHTGLTDSLEIEVAEMLCERIGTEKVRFTTSGCLATMYSIMLSRAFTGRDLVLKIGGGWHGAHPWGLKGVHFSAGHGFSELDSQGLPAGIDGEVMVTPFNDTDRLCDDFDRYGDRIACFIVEPVVGAGGFIAGTGEYMRTARRLTQKYGSVLILDEIIAGFRYHAGTAGSLFGIQPDLTTMGKVIGGGMPVAAVAGRAEILEQAGRAGGGKVNFQGGTFSALPAALLATKTSLEYLFQHEAEIYPRLGRLGEQARRALEEAFAAEGIYVRCTGYGSDVVPAGSLVMPNFPYEAGRQPVTPEDVNDPSVCDLTLRDKAFQLALLLEDVHVVHGGGAISAAHTEADITAFAEAAGRAARRLKPYL